MCEFVMMDEAQSANVTPALVTWRLDYCSGLCLRLPLKTTQGLQLGQNSATLTFWDKSQFS